MMDSKSIANLVQLKVQNSIDRGGEIVTLSVQSAEELKRIVDHVRDHYDIGNSLGWRVWFGVLGQTKEGKAFSLSVEIQRVADGWDANGSPA